MPQLPEELGAETAGKQAATLNQSQGPVPGRDSQLFTSHPPNKEVKWEWGGGKYAFSNHPDLGLQRVYYNLLFPCVENGILSRELGWVWSTELSDLQGHAVPGC